MADQTSDEDKLKILAKIQIDSSPDSLRAISSEMKVPYSRLLKYRKELEQATTDGDISKLIDAEKLTVHRVAEEVKQDLVDLAPKEGELIEAAVDNAVSDIDGYQVLNERLQTTALTIASKINNLADIAVDSKELLILVESLTKLQVAFFSKQTNNINILNNQGGYKSNEVSAFQGLKRR